MHGISCPPKKCTFICLKLNFRIEKLHIKAVTLIFSHDKIYFLFFIPFHLLSEKGDNFSFAEAGVQCKPEPLPSDSYL